MRECASAAGRCSGQEPGATLFAYPQTEASLNIARPLAALVAVLLLSPPQIAHAQDMWPAHGWDCTDTAFGEAEASLDVVARCVRLWEAYRDIALTSPDERRRAIKAMERLYLEGTDRDAHLARHALNRLGVANLPSRKDAMLRAEHKRRSAAAAASAGDVVEGAPASTGRCAVPAPSRSEKVAAKRSVTAGKRALKRKKNRDAIGILQAAVDSAPGYAPARYYASIAYALSGDEARMAEQLECLVAIGTPESASLLRRAREDRQFKGIRDSSPGFKHATGYARIKLGNSLGEYGEDNIDNIEDSLERLGWAVEEVTETPRAYGEPHIWYKPEAKRSAYFIMKVLGHPRTQTHLIDWSDESFDLIIAWGDGVKKGREPRLYVRDPDDSTSHLDDIERAEKEALRKPEAFASEVDKVVGTPERAVDRVEGNLNRAGRTVDRLQKTGEKLDRMFK